MKNLLLFVIIVLFASSCAVTKKYHPTKKFSPQQLQSDYTLFRNILEESHPSLYWYTPKDSMDYYFEKGKTMLHDSLTEAKFRNVLSYVMAKIRCGHTSVKPSKAAARYMRVMRIRSFPLGLKLWPDTAIVTATLNRRDSITIKGSIITAIDGKPIPIILDTLFTYLPADGYNTTHKYQTLSNYGGFANLYNSVFGLRNKYLINYIDTQGNAKSAYINLYNPAIDTLKKSGKKAPGLSHRERKKHIKDFNRSFHIDSTLQTGFVDLNTFVKGYQLPRFFKKSFKKLHKADVQNLVIDLRSNGGGSVTNSTILSRYIADKPFKIADSLYAITKSSNYGRYQQNRLWNWLFLVFMTHRKADGHYHFTYFERHTFKPKKHYHFNGPVYILTGGNTFSASTLFLQSVKGQKNVTIVGEETGGGAYGNTAWLIPDVTLPATHVRFRLPLLRLVMNKDIPKSGHGIMPDVPALPNVQDIRLGQDYKMNKVKGLIVDSLVQ
jgi:hypothetical protein